MGSCLVAKQGAGDFEAAAPGVSADRGAEGLPERAGQRDRVTVGGGGQLRQGRRTVDPGIQHLTGPDRSGAIRGAARPARRRQRDELAGEPVEEERRDRIGGLIRLVQPGDDAPYSGAGVAEGQVDRRTRQPRLGEQHGPRLDPEDPGSRRHESHRVFLAGRMEEQRASGHLARAGPDPLLVGSVGDRRHIGHLMPVPRLFQAAGVHRLGKLDER